MHYYTQEAIFSGFRCSSCPSKWVRSWW